MPRKETRPGRRSRNRRPGSQPTAAWLVEQELGWGLPHTIVVVPALFLLVVRAIGSILASLLASRRDAGPPSPD